MVPNKHGRIHPEIRIFVIWRCIGKTKGFFNDILFWNGFFREGSDAKVTAQESARFVTWQGWIIAASEVSMVCLGAGAMSGG